MWDRSKLLHKKKAGTQDIPESLTHLRVFPVTLLILAATRSMLMCSPTTAAPEVCQVALGFGVTCCGVQHVTVAMPTPAAACLHV